MQLFKNMSSILLDNILLNTKFKTYSFMQLKCLMQISASFSLKD